MIILFTNLFSTTLFTTTTIDIADEEIIRYLFTAVGFGLLVGIIIYIFKVVIFRK